MMDLEDVQVQVVPPADQVGNLAGSALRERFADRVDELTATIQAVAESIRQRVADGLPAPSAGWALDKIDMEFKIELEAGAGVVLARATTTGGFAVTLSFGRRGIGGE